MTQKPNNMKIMVNGAIGFEGVIVKELEELSLSELKTAYNVRLVENNTHPNSGFKSLIDKEMVLIAERIKKIKAKK